MEAMNNPEPSDPNDLIRRALRGMLSEQEQRQFIERLERDASLRRAYDQELGLERLLDALPNAPVSTNFTSLVLEAVRTEERTTPRLPQLGWFRFRFTRVSAGLAVVFVAGLLTLQQYRKVERNEMAQSVSAFSEVASVISEETSPAAVFQDFEAIQQLSLPPESELDLDLLFALQK
jgi:hypothetical protein